MGSTRRRGADVRVEPLALDITDVAEVLAISETLVAQLIRKGELPWVSIPGSQLKRVPYVELKKWVNRLVVEKAGEG